MVTDFHDFLLNVVHSVAFKGVLRKKKCVAYPQEDFLFAILEPKIRMGATRRNLQAQPKTLKDLSEHPIYQSGRKFS
jgi:hypothetical protein